jgi:hypothetical protein
VNPAAAGPPTTAEAVGSAKYRKLPEPIRLDQVTTTKPASDAPAPDMGRDPDHEWMLRFGAS